MWRTGFVALRHVGSSRTRARTHVPCIGRWILNHCATREVPSQTFRKINVLTYYKYNDRRMSWVTSGWSDQERFTKKKMLERSLSGGLQEKIETIREEGWEGKIDIQ